VPFKKLPEFKKLWDAYPGKQTADEVKTLIGGSVNASWITNTCAIRMSHAFNVAGVPVPGNVPYLNTCRGGGNFKNFRYAYRVAEMRKWLEASFGPPTVKFAGPRTMNRAEGPPAQVQGRQGIAVFIDCGWSDASGHFDLWNRDQIGHEAYWGLAKTLMLWACDAKWNVQASTTQRESGIPIVTVGR
jgi:hypothetical protein